jgi:ribosomal protein S18 acetylase RimI-like enzyme
MGKIRLAGPDDAAALLALQRRLDTQSAFMLLEPDERERAPGRLRARLESQDLAGSFDLIAEREARLLGWMSVEVLPFRRARHCGYVVIGVDTAAAGRGIGTALLTAGAAEAQRRGLRRLELTVMTDNLRALSLYVRSGFEVEGLRRQALDRNGTVIDEYYMGRLLPQEDIAANRLSERPRAVQPGHPR